jgi:hypothetical protein
MTRRVLKWIVPADDGRVGTTSTRTVLVFGTGHRIPDGWSHLGSAVCGPFVWHAYSKDTP